MTDMNTLCDQITVDPSLSYPQLSGCSDYSGRSPMVLN